MGLGLCGLWSVYRAGSGISCGGTRRRIADNGHICQRRLIRWCVDRCLASMSWVCLCGRPAAGHAAVPLGHGRSPVSSLAGISPLFCYAPANRFGLPALWTDNSAKPAILLVVRKSAADAGFGRRAIGTEFFGAGFDDYGLRAFSGVWAIQASERGNDSTGTKEVPQGLKAG